MIGKRYLPELRVGIMAGVAYCWTGGVHQRYSLFCLMQFFFLISFEFFSIVTMFFSIASSFVIESFLMFLYHY